MTEKRLNRQYMGVGVSPGFAIGLAYAWGVAAQNPAVDAPVEESHVEREFARFQRAQRIVHDDLARLASAVEQELGTGLADIFRAHLAILHDRSLSREIRAELESNPRVAERALEAVCQRWKERLHSSKGLLLRDHAADVDDLFSRL